MNDVYETDQIQENKNNRNVKKRGIRSLFNTMLNTTNMDISTDNVNAHVNPHSNANDASKSVMSGLSRDQTYTTLNSIPRERPGATTPGAPATAVISELHTHGNTRELHDDDVEMQTFVTPSSAFHHNLKSYKKSKLKKDRRNRS